MTNITCNLAASDFIPEIIFDFNMEPTWNFIWSFHSFHKNFPAYEIILKHIFISPLQKFPFADINNHIDNIIISIIWC